MSAAPPGQIIVTVPQADGTVTTVTLHYDPATRALAADALTLGGTGDATIHVHAAPGAQEILLQAAAGKVSATELAAVGITTVDQLHGLTVTAA